LKVENKRNQKLFALIINTTKTFPNFQNHPRNLRVLISPTPHCWQYYLIRRQLIVMQLRD